MIKNAKKEAASILKEATSQAENTKQAKMLQAKEKFIERKAEHEQVILSREKKIAEVEINAREIKNRKFHTNCLKPKK